MLLFVLQKLKRMVAWHADGHNVQPWAIIVVNNADLGTPIVGGTSSDGGPFNLQISCTLFSMYCCLC